MANRMAKPPAEGKATRFKKGHKGYKSGMPAEIKALRQITRDDLVDLANLTFKGDVVALNSILENAAHQDPSKRPTPIQVLMASCILNAIKKGNATVLNGLLDRFFGRTPIAIQVQKVNEPGSESISGTTTKEIVFETVVISAAAG